MEAQPNSLGDYVVSTHRLLNERAAQLGFVVDLVSQSGSGEERLTTLKQHCILRLRNV